MLLSSIVSPQNDCYCRDIIDWQLCLDQQMVDCGFNIKHAFVTEFAA